VTSPQPSNPAPAQPSPEECRAALERILGSRVFEQAGRASEFLRFVVEETLAGRGDRLKGYTIAVEVFEKPETFDAQSDPLVRVEAGRLRRRLVEYYHGDGERDPVRIELPRGSYAPMFSHVGQPAVVKPVRRRNRFARRSFAAAAIAILTLLVWTAVNQGLAPNDDPAPDPAPRRGPGPRVLVLPFSNLSGNVEVDAVAGGLTEELIRTLVAFNIVATASPGVDAESAALVDLRRRFDVGHVLMGSVRTENDRARIAVRLIDSELGTQLWTATFDEQLDATSRMASQERIARRIGAILSSPYGPVFVHEAALSADKRADALSPYECLLRFYTYSREFDAKGHADSTACMERIASVDANRPEVWSALAVLYLHERTFGYGDEARRNTAIDRALEAARKALDITGNDRVGALAMAGIRLADGDREAFERAAERALETEPLHPAIAARIGYLYVIAGDWTRGLPLVEAAVPETVYVPGWYYSAYALRFLQTGDYAQALEWALKIDAPRWFVTPMTAAAAAGHAGRADIAERERMRLLELDPDFPRVGAERLRASGLNDELVASLLEGLRLAGMSVE
jgi:TolB-like protein